MKSALVIAGVALFAVTACGDDANDAGYQARRAAERAAEFRAEQEAAAAAATTLPEPRPEPDDAEGDDGAPADPAPTTVPPTTLPPIEPTGVVVPVFALDNSFRPQVIEIDVGDEVLWENRGINEHDVIPVDSDGWGVELADFQPGDVYAHVFTEAGTFDYYCSIHGSQTVGMIGTVIVNG